MRLRTLAFGASRWCAVAACTDLTTLTQSNPGALSSATVYTPLNAPLIVNGAISDFECAFSRYVVGSGILTDELADAISKPANFDYDARRCHDRRVLRHASLRGANQQPAIYTTLSIARRSADTAIARLEGLDRREMPAGVNRTKLIGQAYAYAGYSLVLMGEGMCSAAINVGSGAHAGAGVRRSQDRASIRRSSRPRQRRPTPTTVNFATLGRARALLDLGNAAAAARDAAKIPSGVRRQHVRRRHQHPSTKLRLLHDQHSSFATVDPSFRGLTINGAPDPRVAVTNAGKQRHRARHADLHARQVSRCHDVMPVARYAEAQLIVAEAKAAAGDLAGAVDGDQRGARDARRPAGVRRRPGQTAAELKTQIIEERRRELFLEGHRLGDLRRYNLAVHARRPARRIPGGGDVRNAELLPAPRRRADQQSQHLEDAHDHRLDFMRPASMSLAGALVAVSACGVGRAQEPYPGLDAYIAKAVRPGRSRASSVAIVRNDSVIYTKGFGTLGRAATTRRSTSKTLFEIGSSSKAFTATLVAMLVTDGKMRWDDHLTDVSARISGCTTRSRTKE